MKVFVVTKSPVDLRDTFEFIGGFSTKDRADAACTGAGTYKIAEVDLDRQYKGDLWNVWLKEVLDHRQV